MLGGNREKCVPLYGNLVCAQEVRHTYHCVLRAEDGSTRKGKAKVKVTALEKVSYGQAGKARDGGRRVRPGTKKGDSYAS